LICQVVEAIRARFNLSYAGMYLVDETGKWAVLRADAGVVPNAVAGQRVMEPVYRIPVGEGALDKSIRDAWTQFTVASSEIVLPLLVQSRVIGALTMQSDKPGVFGHELDAVLQIMADQIATTLENARLFAASQAAVETARRAYGELSGQAWQELRRVYQAQSYRSDERGVIVGPVIEQPEIERATREGRVIQGDEASDQVRLAVPIKVRGNVIAVLSTHRPDRIGSWTVQEVSMLEELADQLGVALESARLYQDTQRRAAQERLVGQVTDRIRETLDMETVLRTATSEIRRALNLGDLVIRLATPKPDNQDEFGDAHGGGTQ
jgi:GAF domain-containing protein